MALWLQISPGSSEPIYAQVIAQIVRAIARGELLPGDKLPSVRRLAADLVINPNTVARAYSEMERRGLLSTKTGAGTFVTDPALRDRDAAQVNALAERMDNVIAQGLNIGLNQREIGELFTARFTQFTRDGRGGERKK